jgi:hypothetical protein
MWASPLAPPPDRTSAVRGAGHSGVWANAAAAGAIQVTQREAYPLRHNPRLRIPLPVVAVTRWSRLPLEAEAMALVIPGEERQQ